MRVKQKNSTMRVIKISFLFAMLAGFSSCLKSKNDVAGTRNDSGNVVISIAETEYIDQDDHANNLFLFLATRIKNILDEMGGC